MSEVFKEQLVKHVPSGKDRIKKVGVVLAVILVTLICMAVPILRPFTIFVIAAACFGAYYLMTMLSIEYEYAFTNGELDIDIIYNKSRRKRVFNGDVKNFEVMAHVTDTAHTRDFSTATETKDYSSGVTGPNTYAFLASYKGKRQKIIIEPNDVMIKAFSTVITPRKFFKKI